MIANDPQFVQLKNKMDHSIPPLERRDKSNIQQIRRRWKGSHAQFQDVDAQKNHDSTWLLHIATICNKILQVFTQRGKFPLKYSLFS